MAELKPKERFLPCLLDRLTVERAGVEGAGRPVREQRGSDVEQVRQSIIRDLQWLLGTAQPYSPKPDPEDADRLIDDLADYPQAASSTLNYGVPDLVGLTAAGLDTEVIERRLVQAIHRFEPRLMRQGLSVRVIADRDAYSRRALVFEIRATMRTQPYPESLYVVTSVDVESGQARVEDKGHG